MFRDRLLAQFPWEHSDWLLHSLQLTKKANLLLKGTSPLRSRVAFLGEKICWRYWRGFSLSRHNLTHRDILEELPLEIHNSHLVTSLLHTIETPSSSTVLSPNYDTLDLSVDPYLEKNLEYLIEGMDEWTYEQGNLQYFQRQLGREQAKIATWQAKRV